MKLEGNKNQWMVQQTIYFEFRLGNLADQVRSRLNGFAHNAVGRQISPLVQEEVNTRVTVQD